MPDNKNPWNNQGKKPGELEDLIQQGLKKIFNLNGGKKGPTGGGDDGNQGKGGKLSFGFILIIIFTVFIGYNSFYQVEPGEQGVVMRFGKFANTSSSGLNFLIPFIEKVVKVDVESIRKEEFGFRQNISRKYAQSSNASDLESLMITSDKNVIQLNWVVQYKIRDPEDFLFKIEDPTAAVRDVSESVIRRLVGNRDFNFVLNNRNELAQSTMKEMQTLLDKYESGIQIVVVQLQDLNPPDPVRPSFNDVNEAEQDRIRLGNEAQKEANEKIPKAIGVAKQMIQESEGYAIERVNKAKGDVARFNSIYAEYKGAKQVTRTRMYIETLKETLPKIQEIVILDQGKNKNMIPVLNFGNGGITAGSK